MLGFCLRGCLSLDNMFHNLNLNRIVTSKIGQLISSVFIQLEVGNYKVQQNVETASTVLLPFPWRFFPTSALNFAVMQPDIGTGVSVTQNVLFLF